MFELLSTSNVMVNIALGEGYQLSYIEAIGTLFGLLCIWYASQEKTINYLFGLINVTLFAVIFFQINLYANLLLQIFFFAANIYGWYAWTRQTESHQVELKIRWLPLGKALIWLVVSMISIGLMSIYIDAVFGYLTAITVSGLQGLGVNITMPVLEADPHPFWDSTMAVLSIVAMLLMTRKYVENWLLWIIIDLISIVIFISQGVYVMAIEYVILTFIAINGTVVWVKSAKENGSAPLSRGAVSKDA